LPYIILRHVSEDIIIRGKPGKVKMFGYGVVPRTLRIKTALE
jgi:hypothetical protein